MKSKSSLKDQLLTNYGGGFELHSWTNLPHGSGKISVLKSLQFFWVLLFRMGNTDD